MKYFNRKEVEVIVKIFIKIILKIFYSIIALNLFHKMDVSKMLAMFSL